MVNILDKWKQKRLVDKMVRVTSQFTGISAAKIMTNGPMVNLSLAWAARRHSAYENDIVKWLAERDVLISMEDVLEVQKTNPKALLDMLKDPVLCGVLVSIKYPLNSQSVIRESVASMALE